MQKIEISPKTIVFFVFFILSLYVLWLVRELLYAIFLAFIFMSALKPSVNLLEKNKVPRGIAAFFVFFTAFLTILFAIYVLLPPVIIESISFIKTLPVIVIDAFPFLSKYLNQDSFIKFLPNITDNFVRIASGLFSNVVFIISVFFFTFYFLLEEKFLSSFVYKFFEKDKAKLIVSILNKAEKRMNAWVWGELILMSIIGLLTYIGLSLLKVPFALPLAFVAGIFEVVPMIGPTLSTIPAFFVASSSSFWLGGLVIILYIVIQQLENNFIVPFVMKSTVGLNPIVTLVALSVGGKLGGFMGILLSVPFALLLETIILQLIEFRKAQDKLK